MEAVLKLIHVLKKKFLKIQFPMKYPIIAILGSTGTGKSKLALQLAQDFGGEIISADSMQVYKGLDIITNKVTAEEQELVPHHMLDFLSPTQRFTVVDFQQKALPIIDEILGRGHIPIIVGGTYYYVESLLWKVLVKMDEENSSSQLLFERKQFVPDTVEVTESTVNRNIPEEKTETCPTLRDEPVLTSVFQNNIHLISNESLHNQLKTVDPVTADGLHPNNRRKIIRALQVYEQSGKIYSEHIKEQMSEEGGNSLGGPLRFPNSHILWLQCEQNVLDKRLYSRVDEMMRRGLIDELTHFYHEWNKERIIREKNEVDYRHGLLQSIGFKEFLDYLLLDDSERLTEKGEKLLKLGVENLKIANRQYSRKQVQWIKSRILRRPARPAPPIYALDVTDLSSWESSVYHPAKTILDALIKGQIPSIAPLPRMAATPYARKSFKCDVCDRVFVGEDQWEEHLKSKRHKQVIASKRKADPSRFECDVCDKIIIGEKHWKAHLNSKFHKSHKIAAASKTEADSQTSIENV